MKTFSTLSCIAAAVLAPPYASQAQSVTSNSFNPALSAILNGQYSHYSLDPNTYGISGFLLGEEARLAPEGFALGESELAASANVDDWFYGQMTVSIESLDTETDVRLEEAFVQTTSLPAGFTARAGRFFSDIGYLNSKHAHSWDFVDQPLVYRAMLNNQYVDDGLHVHWVAPLDVFLELGGEAFSGNAFPAGGATHGGLGAWTAFAHVGGDIGTEQSWRAGFSYLNADAEQRESALASGGSVAFTGSSEVWIADFVWKWAAHGNPKTRNVIVQGEYMHRDETGTLADGAASVPYQGTQQGFYLQAVYQFMPQWRVGVRYDRLDADNEVTAFGFATPLGEDHSPSRATVMLDYAHSEFSRLRLQLAEDKSRPESDTQIALQYVMSIGAHGAHQF